MTAFKWLSSQLSCPLAESRKCLCSLYHHPGREDREGKTHVICACTYNIQWSGLPLGPVKECVQRGALPLTLHELRGKPASHYDKTWRDNHAQEMRGREIATITFQCRVIVSFMWVQNTGFLFTHTSTIRWPFSRHWGYRSGQDSEVL